MEQYFLHEGNKLLLPIIIVLLAIYIWIIVFEDKWGDGK